MIDKSKPGLWVYPDGREVIQRGAAGREILNLRWNVAWNYADGICCLCGQTVHPFDATLEHKTAKGSGGSKHDDRQENLGISHRSCNVAKGSMSLEQYLKLPLDVRVRNCQ
jgi:5-methylcytosine-specific restriction endonuclease McrA